MSSLNPKLKDTQFADYHGHGWNFRAVFKRDRKGTLLDKDGKAVADDDPDKFKKAVHLSSIHMELGMQCVDCHFAQDAHGNGHIYGEVAAAIEIDCADCHGTATRYPTLFTSGPAAQPAGTDMSLLRTPGRPQALRMARRQAVPARRARSRQGVGSQAGQGHRQSGHPQLQRRRRRAPS